MIIINGSYIFLLEYEYSLMKKSKTKILKLNRWDYTKKVLCQ